MTYIDYVAEIYGRGYREIDTTPQPQLECTACKHVGMTREVYQAETGKKIVILLCNVCPAYSAEEGLTA